MILLSNKTPDQLRQILVAAVVTAVGLLLLKYLPMAIWGNDILFDASGHIATAVFGLYVLWFFIDQNKQWRIPFFVFAAAVLVIVALQRILVNAHNDVGLLLGLSLGLFAIGVSRWKSVKKKLKF